MIPHRWLESYYLFLLRAYRSARRAVMIFIDPHSPPDKSRSLAQYQIVVEFQVECQGSGV